MNGRCVLRTLGRWMGRRLPPPLGGPPPSARFAAPGLRSRGALGPLAAPVEDDRFSFESSASIDSLKRLIEDSEALYERQLELENLAVEIQVSKYRKVRSELDRIGAGQNMNATKNILVDWYPLVVERIGEEQNEIRKKGIYESNSAEALYLSLRPDTLCVIAMHESIRLAHPIEGCAFLRLARALGEMVIREVQAISKLKRYSEFRKHRQQQKQSLEAPAATASPLAPAPDAPKSPPSVLPPDQSLIHYDFNSIFTTVVVGSRLLNHVIGNCMLDHAGQTVPAFLHEMVSMRSGHRTGMVRCHSLVSKMIEFNHEMKESLHARYLPMVMPPIPWSAPRRGGFISQNVHVMRTRGSRLQSDVLSRADLSNLYRSLNILGSVGWRIHQPVYHVVKEVWDNGGGLGDIPWRDDVAIPLEENRGNLREFKKQLQKIHRENANRHSLRCDTLLKLEQCQRFLQDVIYFPYNVDFRGRVYPVPPHLNHIGSDMCRGLLTFQQRKPLGERGWYWLKVHCSNKFGNDKVSFADRVAFTEDHFADILDSAMHPLSGNRWWLKGDSPWQLLAACFEVTEALKLTHPESYECSLPVHQDGSCNGLQHYAALGRDRYGAEQVNLVQGPKPSDVYTGVLKHVKLKVREDLGSADEERRQMAGMLKGGDILTRKIVKQTVMTSVYGVTDVGARKQIENQLKAIQDSMETLREVDDSGIWKIALYLTGKTMDSLGEVNQGATTIMEWLNVCASVASHRGYPMMWVTPLGLPIVQPYRKNKKHTLITNMQSVTFQTINDDSLPILPAKQRSAFPPNFVHSLDSTHMMMTARAVHKLGLTFASVHDSYWTHASDIDVLNSNLRQQFVDLYTQPILENLSRSLKARHPDCEFPPPPPTGDLDLRVVLDSPYFFN